MNLCYRDCSPAGCLVEIISVECSNRDRRLSRSDRLSGHKERGSAGGAAAGAPSAVSRGVAESTAGIFSVGIDKAAAGVLSNGTAGVAAVTLSPALLPSTGGVPRAFIGAADIAQDDWQPVLAAADDHDLRVVGLRELKRSFDAPPSQIGVRDPVADGLLEFTNTFCFDRLSLRLSSLAFDAKLILLRDVVLLSFAINRLRDGCGQLNPVQKRIVKDEPVCRPDFVGCILQDPAPQALYGALANLVFYFLSRCRIDLLSSVFSDDAAHLTSNQGAEQYPIVWPDHLMKGWNGLRLQPKSDIERCVHTDAVIGDGVVCVSQRLQ